VLSSTEVARHLLILHERNHQLVCDGMESRLSVAANRSNSGEPFRSHHDSSLNYPTDVRIMTESPDTTARPQSTQRFITRLSGLPVNAVEQLTSPSLAECAERLAAVDAALSDSREEMSQALHQVIGVTDVKAERNCLIALRRDLYNGRRPSPARLAAGRSSLPTAEAELVDRHCALLCEQHDVSAEIRALHANEVFRTRAALQAAVGDTDFCKGVLASSPTLFRNIARYRKADPAAFGSRVEQIERGLLRYFTRAAMKATPFSTLCALASGAFVGSDAPRFHFRGDVKMKRGFVRLNKQLYGLLWAHLRQRPGVQRMLRMELNPTLSEGADEFRFLAALDSGEVFQRVKRTEPVSVVVGVVRDRADATLGELIDRLVADPDLDTTVEDATAFAESLLRIGLIRCRAEVPDQEVDWDLPLRDFLSSVDDEHAAIVVGLLAQLREHVDDYAAATVGEREAIGEQVRLALADACKRMGRDMPAASDLTLYEDASLDAVLEVALSDDLRQTLEAVAELGRTLADVSALRAERTGVRHFFDATYPGASRVPFLTFYEDFQREHYKPHLDKLRRLRAGNRTDEDLRNYNVANPFRLEAVDAISDAMKRITAVIGEEVARSPLAPEVSVPSMQLATALDGVPRRATSFLSMSVFCQLVFDEGTGGWRCVLSHPAFHTGFGKYFSRFLYTLPSFVLDGVRETNRRLTNDLVAEIAGDSFHNANLHPPLLEWEISHPSGDRTASGATLPVADLDVATDPNDPLSVQLVRRSDGRRVHAVDLGFLNPMRRGPLHQLLWRFSPVEEAVLRIPDVPEAERTTHEGEGGSDARVSRVTYRPRIVIGGRVVVARRLWTAPGRRCPMVEPGESPADYFVRVNRWRYGHGIPTSVYVRVFPMPAAPATEAGTLDSGAPPTEANSTADDAPGADDSDRADGVDGSAASASASAQPSRKSRDYCKPQFIDFSSPLLVALFGRLPVGLKEYTMAIEESYPAADKLPGANDERFATELVLQFDFPDDGRQGDDANTTSDTAVAHA
jgi:hypothetical protein